MNISEIPRDDFIHGFKPARGEHVTIIAPTGYGKSYLLAQLLSALPNDQLTIILDTKPRNVELDSYVEDASFRVTSSWPPAFPMYRLKRNRRWIVRCHQIGDPDADADSIRRMIQTVSQWCYNHAHQYGGCRLVFDEGLDAANVGLTKLLEMLWRGGRSMWVAVWFVTQRPRGAPLMAYSQPTHVLFARSADEEDLDRMSKMGGVDPQLIKDVLRKLRKYYFLYICRDPESGGIISP